MVFIFFAVAPYIEAPKLKNVVARSGKNVLLPCNVLFGNPAPSIKWEFIAPDSTTKILYRYSLDRIYVCVYNLYYYSM